MGLIDLLSRPFSAAHRAAPAAGERRSALTGAGLVPAAPVLSGTYVTPQTALGLAAVWCAIHVISRDVATLPKGIFEKLPGGGLRRAEEHPLNDLLTVEADDDTSSFKFELDSMGHTLGWGNGYAEIERDPRTGRPESLHLLDPGKTKVKRSPAGKLYYELETGKTLGPEDCLHFAGMGYNGVQGYSVVTVGRQTIGLGIAADQFGAAFFGNGAVSGGILKLKKKLKEVALNNLRRSFNQVHQGSQSAHQVMILEEDMDWTPTTIPPDEAQFLGTRQFQVLDVARLFGIPPHKLGDYTNSHMRNIEESNIDYFCTTLSYWVTVRESEFNRKLLTRADRKRYVIRYDFEGTLRGDTQARMHRYQTLRNAGALSADEIRIREGLLPIGPEKGGDLYLVQGQYLPLDQVGKRPDPAAAPAAAGPDGAGGDAADDTAAAGDSGPDAEARFNPNHGPDGRFTSGAGGGGGGKGDWFDTVFGGDSTPTPSAAPKSAGSGVTHSPADDDAFLKSIFGKGEAPQAEAPKPSPGGGPVTERGVAGMDTLSKAEKQAVDDYSTIHYSDINNALRRPARTDVPESYKKINEQTRREALERAAVLDGALAKGSLARDVTVYRGTTLSAYGGSPPAVGSTLVDRGFLSTSTSRGVAESFSHDAVLEIRAKKGAPAVDVSHVAGGAESEVLLNRGAGLKVRGVRQEGGRTVIEADLVKPKGKSRAG